MGIGRYQLVEQPQLSPGHDFITRTTVGPFIDTGYDVPFEVRGRVYLSVDTIREMALEAGLFDGLVSQDRADRAYNDGYVAGVKDNLGGQLSAGLEHLDSVLDSLRGLGIDLVAADEGAPEDDLATA